MSSSSKPAITTIPHGATWTHFNIPTGQKTQDILLSFPDDKLFATHPHPHMGNTIGRIANRIAEGKIPNLNGKDYEVSVNETIDGFPNSLHGGHKGWGKHDWSGPENVTRGTWDDNIKNLDGQDSKTGYVYTLTSPDGDEGFPGKVQAWTYYYEGRGPKGEVVLEIEYEAKLIDDKVESTVIGMTNHAYFNLNGPHEGASTREEEWHLGNHTATLATSSYLELESKKPGIPTGHIKNHPEVPEKANTEFILTGDDGKTRAIDDCFILPEFVDKQDSIKTDTRSEKLQTIATVTGKESGITLKVQSTEPAFQFYTGKFTDVGAYEGGRGYGSFSGFCIEPSRFVDAAARENWRGQALLKKGEVFGARNRYWGWGPS